MGGGGFSREWLRCVLQHLLQFAVPASTAGSVLVIRSRRLCAIISLPKPVVNCIACIMYESLDTHRRILNNICSELHMAYIMKFENYSDFEHVILKPWPWFSNNCDSWYGFMGKLPLTTICFMPVKLVIIWNIKSFMLVVKRQTCNNIIIFL